MKTALAADDFDPAYWEAKWWQALKDSVDNVPEVCEDMPHEPTDHPRTPQD